MEYYRRISILAWYLLESSLTAPHNFVCPNHKIFEHKIERKQGNLKHCESFTCASSSSRLARQSCLLSRMYTLTNFQVPGSVRYLWFCNTIKPSLPDLPRYCPCFFSKSSLSSCRAGPHNRMAMTGHPNLPGASTTKYPWYT